MQLFFTTVILRKVHRLNIYIMANYYDSLAFNHYAIMI